MLAVFNFSDRIYKDYEVRLSGNHMLRELINSAGEIYGGNVLASGMEISVRNGNCHMNLEPYSGRLFQIM